MKNAQHNTHTRNREVKGESETGKFKIGKKCFSLFDHEDDRPFGRLPLRYKTERKLI